MYIYTYINTYLHIYLHMYIYTYINTYLHIYLHSDLRLPAWALRMGEGGGRGQRGTADEQQQHFVVM